MNHLIRSAKQRHLSLSWRINDIISGDPDIADDITILEYSVRDIVLVPHCYQNVSRLGDPEFEDSITICSTVVDVNDCVGLTIYVSKSDLPYCQWTRMD